MKSAAMFLCLAVLAGGARAQSRPAATANAVRVADQAFEARAQAVGAAQAFRDFMDPVDGLQFAGGPPIRGAEAIYKAMGGAAKDAPRLEWTLVDAWGAASGDMGVTTRTWKLTANGAAAPMVTGRHVTVWRKDAGGVWKGLIDIGAPDPK